DIQYCVRHSLTRRCLVCRRIPGDPGTLETFQFLAVSLAVCATVECLGTGLGVRAPDLFHNTIVPLFQPVFQRRLLLSLLSRDLPPNLAGVRTGTGTMYTTGVNRCESGVRTPTAAVDITGLHMRYRDVVAVDHVDLTVQPG